MVLRKQDHGGNAGMLPMYYWLMPTMPWVMAMRWAALMLPPMPAPESAPSAEIIPFPPRRSAGGRRGTA
jgi:hypothetical protein